MAGAGCELRREPVALGADFGHLRGDVFGEPFGDGLLCEAVDVVGIFHACEKSGDGFRRECQSEAKPRHAPRLREGLQDDEVPEFAEACEESRARR